MTSGRKHATATRADTGFSRIGFADKSTRDRWTDTLIDRSSDTTTCLSSITDLGQEVDIPTRQSCAIFQILQACRDPRQGQSFGDQQSTVNYTRPKMEVPNLGIVVAIRTKTRLWILEKDGLRHPCKRINCIVDEKVPDRCKGTSSLHKD